jgi:hypothetical protein
VLVVDVLFRARREKWSCSQQSTRIDVFTEASYGRRGYGSRIGICKEMNEPRLPNYLAMMRPGVVNPRFTPPPTQYFPGFQTAVQATTAPPPPPSTGGVTGSDVAKFMALEVAPFFIPGGAFVKGARAGAKVLGALANVAQQGRFIRGGVDMAKMMAAAPRVGHTAHHVAHGAHVVHGVHGLVNALSSNTASGQPALPGRFVYVPSRGGWVPVGELQPGPQVPQQYLSQAPAWR